MKNLKNIFLSLGVAATLFGTTACTGDLDLQPRDPSEITDANGKIDNVFADLYLQFATYGANGNSPVSGFDGGMAAFQRAMFIAEEIPTDEASWIWDPADYGVFNYGTFNANIGCLYGFYSRLIINITLSNQFIQALDNGEFGEVDAAKAANYRLQAKTLWGACYYYMLSFYDNVPYADETTPVGAEPTQRPRAEVYNLVTSQLEDVVAAYGANQTPLYGFVGLDAAESILAKIYLNGEVFAGKADYAKCYQHCKNVIDRLGKGGYYGNGLARSYNALFGANNKKYVIGNPGSDVNEIIWSIAGDNINLTGYSGANFLIAGWIGTNAVQVTMGKPTQNPALNGQYEDTEAGKILYTYVADPEQYEKDLKTYNEAAESKKDAWQTLVNEIVNGVPYSFNPTQNGYVAQDWYNYGNGWKCMVARKSFVRKFEWEDVDMSVSNDRRVSLWQTSAHGFTADNVSIVGDDWGKNGYLCPKYSNWAYNEDGTIDAAASPTNISMASGDYAAIRLAEIYLTAAEAILQGGGGSEAEALQYVNYIRQRAYGDPAGDESHFWARLSMQDLRDERCRELYQENVRRTDLIRWNQWCTGYTWEWKGGIQNGTNLPEYTKLYPIPTRTMVASSFQQTTGY
ncbi:MAG: RagB/SusD family nutrient uptake outer membrane protein [Muribaculaceae bacterium]|nr:RagB/SusD family nutrient uptake outer membrane protein [Muribaculaceae bacterium]